MTRNRSVLRVVLGLSIAAMLMTPAQQAFAKTKDDFGNIVRHIETHYQVHRQHRFAMGLAGFVVKFWHVAGVKNFKGAIFENGKLTHAAGDNRFDEIVRAAMDSGWQPMVQEFDRRSGERTYIYAQDLGQDLKVLVVVLESEEAVVIQVKLNPNKLTEFVEDAGLRRHGKPVLPAETREEQVELAATATQPWEGTCLMQGE